MSRKTLNVRGFVEGINRAIAESTSDPKFRFGLLAAAEAALMASGNYKGFTYLGIEDIPDGEIPGVRWVEGKPDFTDVDVSRVCFYV